MISSLHAVALAAAVQGVGLASAQSPPPAVMTIELAPLDTPPPATPEAPKKTKAKQQPPKPAVKTAKAKPTPLSPANAPAEMAAMQAPKALPQTADLPQTEPAPEVPLQRVQSQAVPNWQGELLAHLERHKRYPRGARMRRDEGVTVVRFVMNRDGQVLLVKLERSSGTDSLDEESLALLDRAQPLPVPPEEVTGERIELVVPVQFRLR